MPWRRFVWIGGYPSIVDRSIVTRPPSGSFRLISYETQRDRLITVEFVAQLYRQPLRLRTGATSSLRSEFCRRQELPTMTTRTGEDRFFRRRGFERRARSCNESSVHSLPGNSSKPSTAQSHARLIATTIFGDKSVRCFSGLIELFATSVHPRQLSSLNFDNVSVKFGIL